MSFKKFRLNIFTVLIIAASLSILFRAINIVTYKNDKAIAVSAAEDAKVHDAAGEKTPEITPEEIKKSIGDTQKALGDKPEEVAKEAAVEAAKEKTEGPDSVKPPSGEAAPADTSGDERSFSASELDVLQSLSKRRAELDAREKKIAEREALTAAAGQEIDKKIAELNQLKGDIQKLLGQQQTMEEDRIKSLVTIYENMKPKEAATIFNTLDMDVLLNVIGRMNERKSSPILAAMDPEKARIVTIRLAEQRKLPSAPGNDKANAPSAPPAGGGSPQ